MVKSDQEMKLELELHQEATINVDSEENISHRRARNSSAEKFNLWKRIAYEPPNVQTNKFKE